MAVRGIDLDVRGNEIVTLIGPNGAGKTSVLRAVSGLVASKGSIRFDGEDARHFKVEALARRGLIHVPEGRHIFPSLTVHENLLVGMAAGRRRDASFQPADVYDLFPQLGPLRRRDGWMLSGGEQQMLAIGRALVAAPRLLLLDEPSLGLSPKLTKVVYDALANIATRIPMLLVEQNTTMALAHCTRAAVMLGGRLVLEGTADEFTDRAALIASYLGGK